MAGQIYRFTVPGFTSTLQMYTIIQRLGFMANIWRAFTPLLNGWASWRTYGVHM
jgi:hypothetical protein